MNVSLIFKRAAILPIIVLMVGCANQGQIEQRVSSRSVAILGVTLAPGVKSGRSKSAMAQQLDGLVRTEGGYQTLPVNQTELAMESVAPGSFDTLLSNFARSGQLSGHDIRALQAARLPVYKGLIARIESNTVRPGNPKRIRLRNNAGQILADREKIVLSTLREMQVRAAMIDLASGRVIWSKSYRATPSAESSYVNYSGSSFSGSLAASLANTMSNGLKTPAGPVAPSNQLTLLSLLREIVRNLPSR